MNEHQKKLFSFLIGNMKDMETELRAQSIVFAALVNKVITIEELGDALHRARNSSEMLSFVRSKYQLLAEDVSTEEYWNGRPFAGHPLVN